MSHVKQYKNLKELVGNYRGSIVDERGEKMTYYKPSEFKEFDFVTLDLARGVLELGKFNAIEGQEAVIKSFRLLLKVGPPI